MLCTCLPTSPVWVHASDRMWRFCNRCGVRWGKGKLELPDGSKAVHPGAARKAAQAAAEAAACGAPQPMDTAPPAAASQL
jgi:hypothetical protein